MDKAIRASDIEEQQSWSRETFGPGQRLGGVVKHIRKEVDEAEANPTDVTEWVDILILAIDGAWRQGYAPNEIIQAYHDKMRKNQTREWPDWRGLSENEPIEHSKGSLDAE